MPEQLHRLHGLRDASAPTRRSSARCSARTELEDEARGDRDRGRPRDVRGAMVEDAEVLRRPARRSGRRRACSRSSSTRSKCKGCAECVTVCDDNALKMIPKTEAGDGPASARAIATSRRSARRDETLHQRQPAHRHDAQGADARLRRRGRVVRRLRRGDGAADDVRGDRREVRRPVGHRRGHRAATRSTPRRIRTTRTSCRGRTRCSRTRRPTRWACGRAGIRWAGRTGRCGASAATGRCSTSASSRSRGCSPSGMNIKVLRARHAGLLATPAARPRRAASPARTRR